MRAINRCTTIRSLIRHHRSSSYSMAGGERLLDPIPSLVTATTMELAPSTEGWWKGHCGSKGRTGRLTVRHHEHCARYVCLGSN